MSLVSIKLTILAALSFTWTATYFTAGEKEVRAWTFKSWNKGSSRKWYYPFDFEKRIH